MNPMKLYFAFVRSGSGVWTSGARSSGVLGRPAKPPGAKPAHPCPCGSRFVHWCAAVLEQEGAIHKAVPHWCGEALRGPFSDLTSGSRVPPVREASVRESGARSFI